MRFAWLAPHSLFWRLAIVLVLTAVMTMVLGVWLMGELRRDAQRLGSEARQVLSGYAAEAEQAWRDEGEQGVAAWLAMMRQKEAGNIMVVDHEDQSLSGTPLTERERAGLRFQRSLNGLMSFRYGKRMPYIGIPFSAEKDAPRLILQLPPRYRPGTYWPYLESGLLVGIPAVSALLLGLLLFWRVRGPLRALQDQVLHFKDDTAARVGAPVVQRRDEFGELARSFNRMADKVSTMMSTQKQLLNDMSHELRTPLSRLAVALESPMDEAALRERLAAELASMRDLVDDTLALGWQDTQVDSSMLEGISIHALWDLVVDNAGFESGWARERFPCQLPAQACVHGHLNVLAQAFENLVRNAIRHSPAHGSIVLSGSREGDVWHLTLTDQGPGVPDASLETIFSPFVRLEAARNETGFGLGLSIARRALTRLGGEMWAENAHPGLIIHMQLPACAAV